MRLAWQGPSSGSYPNADVAVAALHLMRRARVCCVVCGMAGGFRRAFAASTAQDLLSPPFV